MKITDNLVDTLHNRAKRIIEEQGYVFIGQYEDGTYFNLNIGKVKARAAATRLLTEELLIKKNLTPIKIKCRKSSK